MLIGSRSEQLATVHSRTRTMTGGKNNGNEMAWGLYPHQQAQLKKNKSVHVLVKGWGEQ